jgi:cellulose synthase (UDP-forming)
MIAPTTEQRDTHGSTRSRRTPLPPHLEIEPPPPVEKPSPPPLKSDWYFSGFEGRRPPEAVSASPARDFVFQALATAAFFLGVRYLVWRYFRSINPSALWFSIPLLIAETLAFVGTALFFLSIWRTKDTEQKPPPMSLNDTLSEPLATDRPLIVDVFFPTYNEDVELVRIALREAKAMTYPFPIDVRIHALDDGKRPEMARVAAEEGVNYITRSTNIGYKAGNLRNAMEQTAGDFILICDADTRPFPKLLEETLGYFRDPKVAWVQTPQWFFDLDEGEHLADWLGSRLGAGGRLAGRVAEAVVGPIMLGADGMGNDPQLFYDVIQRRRNWCNGSFCCGAGSIHRREAVMEAALKAFALQVERSVNEVASTVTDAEMRADLAEAMGPEIARELELTPYKFHVSEDIYTSILLHSDVDRGWRSVYHPRVLTKMLSPQDLLTWSIQRFKYAGGTLDIFRNDNPLRKPGLSAWQKLTYGATIYSYLAPLWNVLFLLAPILYLFTGIAPLRAYTSDFYSHLLPFLVVNKIAFVAATRKSPRGAASNTTWASSGST